MLMYYFKFNHKKLVEVMAALKLLRIKLGSGPLFDVVDGEVTITFNANLGELEKGFLALFGVLER